MNFKNCIKGLESSKRKNLYYSRKVYENFRVFGYIDADLFEKKYISYDPQKAKYMTICGQKLWNGLSLKGCKFLNVTVRKYIFLNILRY